MSFDPLARHYRWMEFVLAGGKLQRCRTAFLHRVTEAQRVLIAGEGNGRFLVECRRQLPSANVTVLDSSAGMLNAARRRLAAARLDARNLDFLHTDVRRWTPPKAAYDLIVTHFFLDCFPSGQLEEVVAALARSASRNAAWLLADFQVPAAGWRRQRARIIHALMYAFFRRATRLPARVLIPPAPVLERQGFSLGATQTSEWDLLHTDLWVRRESCLR